jgi:hypothetical protein
MSSLFLRSRLTLMHARHAAATLGQRGISRLERRIRHANQPARTDRLVARGDLGQTTAEYGLVILAAGSLALAAILWARSSGSITDLFENVIDRLTGSL